MIYLYMNMSREDLLKIVDDLSKYKLKEFNYSLTINYEQNGS